MSDRIEKLLTFLKDSPKDSFLNHALALEYIKANNDEQAKEVFERNLQIDENYVATYYHYAKLCERIADREKAIALYEKGMQVAKEAKDMHAYSELQSAYEDLVY